MRTVTYGGGGPWCPCSEMAVAFNLSAQNAPPPAAIALTERRLAWPDCQECRARLWTDSSYAALGGWRLLEDAWCLPCESQRSVAGLSRVGCRFTCCHVPSHVHEADCASFFWKSWLTLWNAADAAAKMAHTHHSTEVLGLWSAALCKSPDSRSPASALACGSGWNVSGSRHPTMFGLPGR